MADGQVSNGLQGAAGGALTGAALGSVVPGVGTAIGAIGGGLLGGLGGFFGGQGGIEGLDEEKARLQALADMYGGREAPQMGMSDFRGNQSRLAAMLEAQAQGMGPSLAKEQFEAATQRNQRSAESFAAGATGPNAALAQFQAQTSMANMGAQAAQDSAAARIAEANAARQQLGLVLQGARGQDEGVGQANLEAKLRQMGINDQAQLNALGQKYGLMMGSVQVPSFGERLLAGGAGAFGTAAASGAFNRRPTTPGASVSAHERGHTGF